MLDRFKFLTDVSFGVNFSLTQSSVLEAMIFGELSVWICFLIWVRLIILTRMIDSRLFAWCFTYGAVEFMFIWITLWSLEIILWWVLVIFVLLLLNESVAKWFWVCIGNWVSIGIVFGGAVFIRFVIVAVHYLWVVYLIDEWYFLWTGIWRISFFIIMVVVYAEFS